MLIKFASPVYTEVLRQPDSGWMVVSKETPEPSKLSTQKGNIAPSSKGMGIILSSVKEYFTVY